MQNNTSSLKLWLAGAGVVALLLVGWASPQAQQRSKQKKPQPTKSVAPKKQASTEKKDSPNPGANLGNRNIETPCMELTGEGDNEPQLIANNGNERTGVITSKPAEGEKIVVVKVTDCATDFVLPLRFTRRKQGLFYYQFVAVPNSNLVPVAPAEVGSVQSLPTQKDCEAVPIPVRFRLNQGAVPNSNNEIILELLSAADNSAGTRQPNETALVSVYEVRQRFRVQVKCVSATINPTDIKQTGQPTSIKN